MSHLSVVKPKTAVEKRTSTTLETMMLTPDMINNEFVIPIGQRPRKDTAKVRAVVERIKDDGGDEGGTLIATGTPEQVAGVEVAGPGHALALERELLLADPHAGGGAVRGQHDALVPAAGHRASLRERRGQGLDEDGGLDRAPLDAERILGKAEHLVPQPSLEMGFHLG